MFNILIAKDAHAKGGVILPNPLTTVYISGFNIAAFGDLVSPYDECPTPTMTSKSEKVFIKGRPICMVTDVDSCGTAFSSSTNSKVFIQI